jgi:hypothetical protein
MVDQRRRRRRQKGKVDTVKDLIERIKNQLGGTPLSEVGKRLLRTIELLQYNPERDGLWPKIDHSFSNFLSHLPDRFGPRFHFDAYLLHSIKEEWGQGPASFPDTVVPVYRREWQYVPLPVPGETEGGKAHHLYLIGIDEAEEHRYDSPPWLLDYPLVCHELAHYLLAKYGHSFKEDFEASLENVLRDRAKRRLPLRGQSASVSESLSDDLAQHWSIDERGYWAFEIAVDVIALWACGPAYLETLTHHLSKYQNKFQIEPSHPSAALRADALLLATERLQWSDYTGNLQDTRDDWFEEGPPSFNRYNALTDEKLVRACIDSILPYCKEMKLPQLRPNDLTRIQNRVEKDQELVGTDLIVGAWIVEQNCTSEEYEVWQASRYDKYVAALDDEE